MIKSLTGALANSFNEVDEVETRRLVDFLYNLFRSKNRTRIYLYLVKHGYGSADTIRKATKIPMATFYRHISYLESKKYIRVKGKIENGSPYGGPKAKVWELAR